MISVIIPCWGEYDKFLPECLESIAKQTYNDYEVIIPKGDDLPTARNNGIKDAKGEWVIPLDVDDTIDSTLFEKTVGKGDIIAFGHRDIRGDHFPDKDLSLENFLKGNRIIACTVFKKKVWEDIGGYDESLKEGYEDWDFWIRALKFGYAITVIPEVLYTQRTHEGSMITKVDHEKTKNIILRK